MIADDGLLLVNAGDARVPERPPQGKAGALPARLNIPFRCFLRDEAKPTPPRHHRDFEPMCPAGENIVLMGAGAINAQVRRWSHRGCSLRPESC
eukprot:scaffold340141_cov19-Prasinocladus_malaysianus.AAC.1